VKAAPDIQSLGARILVIGNGSPKALGRFGDAHAGTVTIVTDPEKVAYKALSLVHGMGGLKGLSMVGSGIRAWRKGHRQAGVQGDPLQQGGVFVINRKGQAVYAQRSSTAGDHADLTDVMQVLRNLD
jgi:hypothetical protein